MIFWSAEFSLSVSTILRRAGKHCLQTRETLGVAVHNAGRDIKLRADESLNVELARDLHALFPVPVYTEESGWSGSPPADADLHWIIDPLDGSYNYWRGQPAYCISVAICRGRAPVFGAIYDIINDDIYLGGSECPATCNGQPIAISDACDPRQSCLMTGLPLGADFGAEALSDFASGLGGWKKVRMIGSAALSLIYVATGRADFYQENGIFWWDVAAGLAIIKAAGGTYRVEGGPEPKSPLYVAAGCQSLLASDPIAMELKL